MRLTWISMGCTWFLGSVLSWVSFFFPKHFSLPINGRVSNGQIGHKKTTQLQKITKKKDNKTKDGGPTLVRHYSVVRSRVNHRPLPVLGRYLFYRVLTGFWMGALGRCCGLGMGFPRVFLGCTGLKWVLRIVTGFPNRFYWFPINWTSFRGFYWV